MEGAQALEVLRARFAQGDVLAHNADDVRLLLQGVRKIPGVRHVVLVCRTRSSSTRAYLETTDKF